MSYCQDTSSIELFFLPIIPLHIFSDHSEAVWRSLNEIVHAEVVFNKSEVRVVDSLINCHDAIVRQRLMSKVALEESSHPQTRIWRTVYGIDQFMAQYFLKLGSLFLRQENALGI